MPKHKRLDGKKKLVALTGQMENDMRQYLRDKGIESESELIRQAVAKYIYADYSDDTLKLQGIKTLSGRIEELRDMLNILFRYTRLMHINILAYHPEIKDGEFADEAFKSANMRHNKFFDALRESLKTDPSFFEHLLHKYFTGDGDGQG